MSEPLPSLPLHRKTGTEPFHAAGASLGFDLLGFWQWSTSDLVGNVLRGRLAEYLVAQALGIADGVRAEWDAYDLRTPSDLTIEVKSAAYVQSWMQQRPSAIRFAIQPTYGWNAATNKSSPVQRRHARVYVFCLLHHRDPDTLDPLDVSQWTFYVLSTATLDERLPAQKAISLSTLLRLDPVQADFAALPAAIDAAAARGGAPEPA